MVRIRQKRAFTVFFLFLILLIILTAILSYHQLRKTQKTNQRMTYSYTTATTARNLLFDIVETESNQRGYILSGDKSYLEAYYQTLNQIPNDINYLKQLTINNPPQHAKVDQLLPLLSDRIAFFKALTSKPALSDKTDQLIAIEKSKELTDQITRIINSLLIAESNFLINSNRQAVKSSEKTNILILLISILTAIVFVYGYLMISYQNKKLLAAEILEKETKKLLSEILNGATDVIAAIDKSYNLIVLNQAFKNEYEKLFGHDLVTGTNIKESFNYSPSREHFAIELWQRALNGEKFTVIKEFDDTQQTHFFYETSYYPLKNSEGNIIGAATIARNITKRVKDENILKEANEKLEIGLGAIRQRNLQITLLNSMSEALQSCGTLEDTPSPITIFCSKILEFTAGTLYILHPNNQLEALTSWNNPTSETKVFTPDDCWGLRNGHTHMATDVDLRLICKHAETTAIIPPYICVPLIAHNEILGLFYIEVTDPKNLDESKVSLIRAVSEQIALSIANIKLRQTLRYYSLRDPLTSLYNRRFLEENLGRELSRAKRNKASLAICMLDIDLFKKFNDTFNHEAGDLVLKSIAHVLQNSVRGSDVACRYGGEEFVVSLYGITAKEAEAKANEIREHIAKLQLIYGSQNLGRVTVSIGVAMYPERGESLEELLRIADAALYKAKEAGRNCVVLG